MADAASPAYEHPAVTRMKPRWTLLNDVFGGTERLRGACAQAFALGSIPGPLAPATNTLSVSARGVALYLPKHPAERNDDYLVRLYNTELFNGLKQTIRGLGGMLFAQNPVLGQDVPADIAAHWEDIDYAGTHGDVFSRQMAEFALLNGHHAILVDYPSVLGADDAPLTQAQEQRAGLRPYWQHIRADQILNWRTATLANGEHVLAQVTLRVSVTRATGRFGVEVVDQYLVLWLSDEGVFYERWEAQANGDVKRLTEPALLLNQRRIPLAICYAAPVEAPLETTPPLLDLAYLNLAHFRVQSDHRHSLHLSSVPVLVFIGRDEQQGVAEVGPNAAFNIPLGGDAKFIEHAGAALGATRQELQDLEGRMARTGLSMLQRESAAAETAEAKRLDKAEQDASLASVARSVEDALEQALGFHAAYMGQPGGGSIALNRDFADTEMSTAEIQTYSGLVAAGQLSLDTLWTMMEQGGRLPPDFQPERERARVEAANPLPMFDEVTPA